MRIVCRIFRLTLLGVLVQVNGAQGIPAQAGFASTDEASIPNPLDADVDLEAKLSALKDTELRLAQQLIELAPEHIDCMMDSADQMIGIRYDIGQLLDIAIRGILEYDQDRPLSIFDFGRKRKVCSVGVRVCFEYLYQKMIKPSIPDAPKGKWLFRSLNPDKWPPSEIEKYKGTNVEATAPAHFANTDYFKNEFELVAKFKDGERIS